MDGMVRIPSATFLMGSDRHYPEEVPAHKVTVGEFWIDAGPVTNRDFSRFVRKTGYVTVAERAPDRADYPGARPELLVPFSTVWTGTRRDMPSTFPPAALPAARSTPASRASTGGIPRASPARS
jgi:formylglycine-generating enzyme required for sulfatase activity